MVYLSIVVFGEVYQEINGMILYNIYVPRRIVQYDRLLDMA